MAIQCVVFNCSDQIDYKMMGKLFRQLLVLREGRIAGKSSINFMGVEIKLLDHHVIITMNPGYAGRTELPDNLQVCFRPVSMMVPNYALIAEIMLFAEGFGDAKTLSRKMCKLYILCSEQLSQQPHYDYGLRAVKSVLVMAGGLKRDNPDISEDLVLIRALRDSNLPKFLADDIPLFFAIIADLFPGVVVPDNDYGEFQVTLEDEITKAGLQNIPGFHKKVIQMFDIFNIRFARRSPARRYQEVRFEILNPVHHHGRALRRGQHGHAGVARRPRRRSCAAVGEESAVRKWTVFDGPIDALWIENMNTVLDDNMTLCLANGERIKLKIEMKMLFEVMDLAVASPATVSRIGVVFMTPSDLGWFPYVQSWAADLPDQVPDHARAHLLKLYDAYFQKALTFQRKKCKEPVGCVDIQLATSCAVIFQSLFCPSRGPAGGKFLPWKQVVPSFKFQRDLPYTAIAVPTEDSTVLLPHAHAHASLVTQSAIESKLEKKRKNLLGAPAGKTCIIFVDDINMPPWIARGAQPPVELLRQFLDFRGFVDGGASKVKDGETLSKLWLHESQRVFYDRLINAADQEWFEKLARRAADAAPGPDAADAGAVFGENSVIFADFLKPGVVEESMLEDINSILNSGEIPNLFPQDELDKICSDMIPVCDALGVPASRDNCIATFITRFPSLINCTTIDWFLVARDGPRGRREHFLASVKLGSGSDELELEHRSAIVRICSIVDVKIEQMTVGTEKLRDTNAIVDGLRGELKELAPVLEKKAVDAEAMLKQVAIDQAEADVVREKVAAEEAELSKQSEAVSKIAAEAQAELDVAMPALQAAVASQDDADDDDDCVMGETRPLKKAMTEIDFRDAAGVWFKSVGIDASLDTEKKAEGKYDEAIAEVKGHCVEITDETVLQAETSTRGELVHLNAEVDRCIPGTALPSSLRDGGRGPREGRQGGPGAARGRNAFTDMRSLRGRAEVAGFYRSNIPNPATKKHYVALAIVGKTYTAGDTSGTIRVYRPNTGISQMQKVDLLQRYGKIDAPTPRRSR
ncbi:dynein light chain binding protein [Aureococcus anophagefferens]|nr:dynein light chain binding protein [Aureococcus anophagefferens]